MNPVVVSSPSSHNRLHQCSLDLRAGNFVFSDSDSGVSVSVFDRGYNKILHLQFNGVLDQQRVKMFKAVLNFDPSTKEAPPPHTSMPEEFLRVVFSTLSTLDILVNGERFLYSSKSLDALAAKYADAISTSAVNKSSSALRVIKLGSSVGPASFQPVSFEELAISLEQLGLNDKPIWIDFNATDMATREDGLARIAFALGIEPTNIAVCASEDPSRVSRRRSDGWWHFCSMAVDKGSESSAQGALLSSTIMHAFVRNQVLVTIHRGEHYSVERIMADMLQGGFCANGEPGKSGNPIGPGYLYSVILASMAHRAEDLTRRVVEDASRRLEDRSIIGSQEQQALAGRVSSAVNVLQQFCDSFDNDVAEMKTAASLGNQYGFDTTYLSKHAGLVQNIGKWMRSINTTVDSFYRQWQTAMDLVQNKSAVLLTRLLGALGTPAAVNSLAELPITSVKGASVAAISAAVGLIIVTLKPRLYGKKIQLG